MYSLTVANSEVTNVSIMTDVILSEIMLRESALNTVLKDVMNQKIWFFSV